MPFDSFVTAETTGPVPWWEIGSGPGAVQEWSPPYKHGVAFRPLVDVLLHGARIWRTTTNKPPPEVSPELCLSNAAAEAPASHHVPYDGTPPAVRGWQTVLFPEPIPIAADEQKLLWISSTTGTGTTPFGREEHRFATPTLSLGGLIETLVPSGRYNTPSHGGPYDAPDSTVDAWYFIDPLVTEDISPPPTITGALTTSTTDTVRTTT